MINVNLFALSLQLSSWRWQNMPVLGFSCLYHLNLKQRSSESLISWLRRDLHPSLPSLIINRLFSILVEHCQSLLTNLGHLQCMSAILSNCTLDAVLFSMVAPSWYHSKGPSLEETYESIQDQNLFTYLSPFISYLVIEHPHNRQTEITKNLLSFFWIINYLVRKAESLRAK